MVQASAIEASHWCLLTGHARRNVDLKATDGAKLCAVGEWSNFMEFREDQLAENSAESQRLRMHTGVKLVGPNPAVSTIIRQLWGVSRVGGGGDPRPLSGQDFTRRS
jgi:hypothetical protein